MHVSCPKCESTYQVSDSFEGKSLKCKGCETVFRARLNRAAIKDHSIDKPTEGKWPSKAPTIGGFKKQTSSNSNLPLILGAGVALLVIVGIVLSLAYVYLVTSPDNLELLRNQKETQFQSE